MRSSDDWRVDFDNGIMLYQQNDDDVIDNAISSIRCAFNKGLNVRSDRERYFQAIKTLSMLYFKQGKYEKVVTHLTNMINNASNDEIPDWVRSYYALSIFNATPLLVAADPQEFFFKYIDDVHNENVEEIRRRDGVCKEMMSFFANVYPNCEEIDKVNSRQIIDKACEYKLNNSEELSLFRDVFLPEYDIPKIKDSILEKEWHKTGLNVNASQKENELIVALEEQLNEKDKYVEELSAKNKQLAKENIELCGNINLLKVRCSGIEEERDKIKQLYDKSIIELNQLNAKKNILENELSRQKIYIKDTDEKARNILREKKEAEASVSDYTGLYYLIEEERDKLQNEVKQYRSENEILKNENEILKNNIEELQNQLACADENAKALSQYSKTEKEDSIPKLIGHRLIVEKVGNKKIGVITDKKVKRETWLKWAQDKSYINDDFKIYDDYDKNKHGCLPKNFGDGFFAFIVGPGAHSMPNATNGQNNYIWGLKEQYGKEKGVFILNNLAMSKKALYATLDEIEDWINNRFA